MAKKFKAKIKIIGINPYVLLPSAVLNEIFNQAGKDKGKIPVTMTIDGHPFTQTLIRYSGAWRLYLNTPMRRAAEKDVGNTATFTVAYNNQIKKKISPHPQLIKALQKNTRAKKIFSQLSPSVRNEIIKYFSFLKTDESVNRNVKRAIQFLLGKERFIGRELPD